MLRKILKKQSTDTTTPSQTKENTDFATAMLGGSLIDMLSVSGRISLQSLQKIRLVCEKDAFVAFVRYPVLVGAGILSGTPGATQTAEQNGTVIFQLTDTSEEAASSSDSLKKAVYPLARSASDLARRSAFFIGRVDSNDIVMPDFALSKRHAAIDIEDGRYRLRDCGSTNGTMLNGRQLGETSQPLHDEDVISFARYGFTFLYPESLYDTLRVV